MELNHRPPRYKRGALTTELLALVCRLSIAKKEKISSIVDHL